MLTTPKITASIILFVLCGCRPDTTTLLTGGNSGRYWHEIDDTTPLKKVYRFSIDGRVNAYAYNYATSSFMNYGGNDIIVSWSMNPDHMTFENESFSVVQLSEDSLVLKDAEGAVRRFFSTESIDISTDK